jgi:hypothetical protein
MKYKTALARVNWTSIWTDVVNKGKWKSRCALENIHVLYKDIEREKRYLTVRQNSIKPYLGEIKAKYSP